MDQTNTHTVPVDVQSRLTEPPCSTPAADRLERSVLVLLHDTPHGMELIMELPRSKYINPDCQRVEHLIGLGVSEDRALQVFGLTSAQFFDWKTLNLRGQIVDLERMLRDYRHRASTDARTISRLQNLLIASTLLETNDGHVGREPPNVANDQ